MYRLRPISLDLAALLVAEKLAGAANLEIVGRQREAGAEFLQGLDRLEPFDRIRRSCLCAAGTIR